MHGTDAHSSAALRGHAVYVPALEHCRTLPPSRAMPAVQAPSQSLRGPQELAAAFRSNDMDAALELATKLRYTTRIGEAILLKL